MALCWPLVRTAIDDCCYLGTQLPGLSHHTWDSQGPLRTKTVSAGTTGKENRCVLTELTSSPGSPSLPGTPSNPWEPCGRQSQHIPQKLIMKYFCPRWLNHLIINLSSNCHFIFLSANLWPSLLPLVQQVRRVPAVPGNPDGFEPKKGHNNLSEKISFAYFQFTLKQHGVAFVAHFASHCGHQETKKCSHVSANHYCSMFH